MLVLHGVKQSRGLDANWRTATDLANGRTHEVADFGFFRTAGVWDGQRYWRQGRSGASHPLDSAFAQRVAETHAWLDRRGYLRSAALGARVEDLGERTADGKTFAALRATPPHGAPIELWFDEQNWLLARSVQGLSTGIETVRYSNYQRIDQILVPFRVVTDDNGDVETVEVDHAVLAPLDVREFQRPAPPADFSVAGGKTTVPIEVDGFVVVDAKINGAGPFAFILDTGGRAILTPSVAEQLGLTLKGGAVARGAGGGGLKTQFANLDRLEIGGAAVRDLSVAVVPLGFDTLERGAKRPFAGILGLELFERLAVKLDYPGRRMTLEPLKSHVHQGGGVRLPLTFDDDMPRILIRINEKPAEAALDTGFPETLTVERAWAERAGLAARLHKGLPVVGGGAVGGDVSLRASRLDVAVAGAAFPHLVAYYSESSRGSLSSKADAGIVGNEVLSDFIVDFDYRRGEVWFERVAGHPTKPFDRAGLMVEKPNQGLFTVISVLSGSPAAEAGLKVGDQITSVDQTPAAQLSGYDFGRIVRQRPGTELALTFTREGTSGQAKVTLRELLP